MKEKNRIEWLDGFKGIACVLIFIHHFLLAFFPSVHYGEAAVSHGNGVDVALAQSPFSVLVNGNFLVALFCMISGVVISLQVMNLKNKNDLADVTVKRYFRLMLPLLPVGVLVFVLLRFGMFTNLESVLYTQSPWAELYYREPISFGEFLKSVLIDTWFVGDDTLSTAFWMLSKLFYGTFLSIVLSVIAWKYEKHTWLLYAVVAICFFGRSDLLCAFALGTLLAWMYRSSPLLFSPFAGVPILLLGLFLGGFPSGVIPTNAYRFLFGEISSVDWHMLGAVLTLYGLFSLPWLQRGLSIKPFRWLGRISYAVYLLHIPVLFGLSTAIFLWMKDRMGYLYSVGLSFGVSLLLLLVLSWGYHRVVEPLCVKAQRKILSWFCDSNEMRRGC